MEGSDNDAVCASVMATGPEWLAVVFVQVVQSGTAEVLGWDCSHSTYEVLVSLTVGSYFFFGSKYNKLEDC